MVVLLGNGNLSSQLCFPFSFKFNFSHVSFYLSVIFSGTAFFSSLFPPYDLHLVLSFFIFLMHSITNSLFLPKGLGLQAIFKKIKYYIRGWDENKSL